ncbi:MAG: tRNA (adenosine(37)-N6)-threonylcarbamoyltransferase complex dimerization subunit type 1 TsaB [Anaerolineae bacterium]|nr:tRNA (adenosine(37)-N6)-threonylcarbamoyltransferase complex dimerization subunit type 1 TsaB [Anaerolineae bacterium]
MKILCIDTSTRHNWIGFYNDGKISDVIGYEDRQSCLINLMPSIKMVLDNAQTSLSAIDALATIVGPGAWSSLRIGAATVKQLSLVNQKPLYAISNNDLLAEWALQAGFSQRHILAAMDAQSGKAYAAQYHIQDGQKTRISDYQWADAVSIVRELPTEVDDLLIVGDGAYRFENAVRHNWLLNYDMPQADSRYLELLGRLAENAPPVYNRDEIILFKPLYIQPSSAEVEFKVSVT